MHFLCKLAGLLFFSKSSKNMNTFGSFGTFGFKISFLPGFKRWVIVQQTERKSLKLAFNPDVLGSIKPLTAHKFRKLKNSPTQKRIVWPRFIFSHLDQNLSVTATGTSSNNYRIVIAITDTIATNSIASRTHHHCSNCHRLNIITIALLSFINIVLNEKVRIILVNIESYKSFVSSSSAQHQWSEGVVIQLGKGNLRNLLLEKMRNINFHISCNISAPSKLSSLASSYSSLSLVLAS